MKWNVTEPPQSTDAISQPMHNWCIPKWPDYLTKENDNQNKLHE